MTKAFVGDEQALLELLPRTHSAFGHSGRHRRMHPVFMPTGGGHTSGAIIPVDGGLNVSVGDIMFE